MSKNTKIPSFLSYFNFGIMLFVYILLLFIPSYLKETGALVRQRTIPTERPSLVGEVSANFSG
jgi:hypothetical protein